MVAVLWLERGALPAAAEVQVELARAGVPMVWFDDLGRGSSAFAAIHWRRCAVYPMDGLHASPDSPVTRSEAAVALVPSLGKGVALVRLLLTQSTRAGMRRTATGSHGSAVYWTGLGRRQLPARLPRLTFSPHWTRSAMGVSCAVSGALT